MVVAQKNQVAAPKAQQATTGAMKSKSDAEQAAILGGKQQKSEGIQLARAAATSLRILGQTQPKAPTAQRTPRNADVEVLGQQQRLLDQRKTEGSIFQPDETDRSATP